MTPLKQLDRFLLSSKLLGPVVTTGAAVLLGLPADSQPTPVLAGHITLVSLVVCGTWYGIRRSELERAASEARSTYLEDRLQDLILTTRNQSVAAAERAEEVALGALRSSFCGLEAHTASADLAAATTARAYLALLEREGLTVGLGDPAAGSQSEAPQA